MPDSVYDVPDLTGVKILVAEDDEYSLRMLELILEETHAELLYARDGKKAMDMFRSNNVDLVILDIRLPEIDGMQLFVEMLKERPEIYAIAQSAYALDSDREKGLMLGFKEYILKPVDQKTLLKALDQYRISRLAGEIRNTTFITGNIVDESVKEKCDSIPAYVAIFNEDMSIAFANKHFMDRFGDPKGTGYIEFLSNFTSRELKEKTEDLDLAQSVGHIGSWRLNIATNELLWSKETYNLFEVPENESLNYYRFLSFVHPDDRKYVHMKWKNALKGDNYDIEHRIIVNGKVKWVSEKAVLETDPENNLLSGFGVVQDITELKQTTEKLKKSKEELRMRNYNLTRINAMLEDFISIAAHDLRSPVTSIKALSGLIEVEPDMTRRMQLFNELTQIVYRLEKTVDGLVETVNIQRKDDIPAKKLNLNKVIAGVLADFSKLVLNKKAIVTHEFSESDYVVYIEAYLISLFSNIIGNALKYCSPERKPVLNINGKRSGGYFVLSFSDNGAGIDMEKIGENLFKPFKRFTNMAAGTGMGLYLVKNILEKNGGFIKVESTPGEGTTFTCYLKEYSDFE